MTSPTFPDASGARVNRPMSLLSGPEATRRHDGDDRVRTGREGTLTARIPSESGPLAISFHDDAERRYAG